MAMLGLIFLCGLFVDGWAHNHHRVDQSFFTPWHAIFYSGFALLAAFTVGTMVRNHRAGYAWAKSLPHGYGWSFIGVLLFLAAGIGDMIWHMLFGVETNTAALLSPTHLGLASGMLLILTGPFRAAARRPGEMAPIPAILALFCVFSILTFITQYSSPLYQYGVAPAPPPRWFEIMESRGVISQLWFTALMISVMLLMVRTWGARLPLGSVTFLLLANAALMATQNDQYYFLPAVAAAGIVGDTLVAALKPAPERTWQVRGFAALLPAAYWLGHYATYFFAGQSLYYPTPTWTGVIVESGLLGLLLSFAIL